MKRNINNVFIIAQKEFADNVWSPRFAVLMFIFLCISFSYTYSTKFGSSFIDAVQTIAIFAPVIGIALGFDAVVKERRRNSLNVLLTHPVFRDTIITGKILGAMMTLALVVFLVIAVITGTSLIISGKLANFSELIRLFIFGILTFLYLLVFLSIGIFTSVITKSEINSLTYGIITWLNLCVVFGATVMIIATVVTGYSLFDMDENHQFRELTYDLQKLSPIHHYAEATIGLSDLSMESLINQETIKGVLDTRYTLGEWAGEFWENVVVLVVISMILIILSYLIFLRQDITR